MIPAESHRRRRTQVSPSDDVLSCSPGDSNDVSMSIENSHDSFAKDLESVISHGSPSASRSRVRHLVRATFTNAGRMNGRGATRVVPNSSGAAYSTLVPTRIRLGVIIFVRDRSSEHTRVGRWRIAGQGSAIGVVDLGPSCTAANHVQFAILAATERPEPNALSAARADPPATRRRQFFLSRGLEHETGGDESVGRLLFLVFYECEERLERITNATNGHQLTATASLSAMM
jgi:hypothetical protein